MQGILVSAACTGQVDERVHGPQQLVLKYLDLVAAHAFDRAQDLMSSRWRSSRLFKEQETKLAQLDLSEYLRFGRVRGGCLDAVKVEGPNRTVMEAQADCYLKAGDKPVDVSFDVVRDTHTGEWVIDGIRLE